jgi:hypothetical protein
MASLSAPGLRAPPLSAFFWLVFFDEQCETPRRRVALSFFFFLLSARTVERRVHEPQRSACSRLTATAPPRALRDFLKKVDATSPRAKNNTAARMAA